MTRHILTVDDVRITLHDPQHETWKADAACRDTPIDNNPFFSDDIEQVNAARETCKTCPVRRQCLDYALNAANNPAGIWADTTEGGRRDLRKAFRPQHRAVAS